MNKYTLFINGTQIQNKTYPLKWGNFLDQQLDYSTFSIARINKMYFEPTMPVQIVVNSDNTANGVRYQQSKTLDFVIWQDRFRESPPHSGYYNHNITAIEPTKLLEGLQLESLCVTNAGGRNYKSQKANLTINSYTVDNSPADSNDLFYKEPRLPDNVITPQNRQMVLPSIQEIMGGLYPAWTNKSGTITVLNSNGNFTLLQVTADNWNENVLYKLTTGVNAFQYDYTFYVPAIGTYKINITFSIVGIENKLPLKPWTIQDVIERIFELEETLMWQVGAETYVQAPRFKLLIPQGKEEVFTQLSPEFTFTRMSLREALQLIGSYIHAEPRLIYNEQTQQFDTVTFDFYGEQKYAEYYDVNKKQIERLSTYNYSDFSGGFGGEQACNDLDSYVDNLVNRIKANVATIGQPYDGGGQTLRTENATVRYEDNDSLFLPTAYPISQVDKLYWIDTENWVGQGVNAAIDLTPYLYESNIYSSQLSSYDATYPYSKAIALYYTQSQNGIRGFFFKNEEISGGVFANYAIVNVIQAATGYTIPQDINTYTSLSFRVVYTPIYSARIGHSKQYIGDWLSSKRTLNYSQSSNSVETEYYGENIKGAVERLGTLEKVYTFKCRNVETIPNAGMLWDDDYYITTVETECGQDIFKVTVGLSKNFNRISQYIGLSSYKRIYETSEVMVQARETMYRDYVVFFPKYYNVNSDTEVLPVSCLVTYSAMQAVANAFLQKETINNQYSTTSIVNETLSQEGRVTAAQSQGYTKKISKTGVAVTLPVIASAAGNVMEFSWQYMDNFSAGQRKTIVNGNTYGQEVQYSDYYGRVYYEYFQLVGNESNVTLALPESFPILNEWGSPIFGRVTDGGERDTNKLIVRRKDSREAIKNNYAVEFLTADKNMIIGSALATNCPLVSGINKNTGAGAKLVFLRNRINKFAKKVDLSTENVIVEFAVADAQTQNADVPFVKICMRPRAANTGGGGVVYFDGVSLSLMSSFFDSNVIEDFKNYQAWAFVTNEVEEEPYDVEYEDGTVSTITNTKGGDLLIGRNATYAGEYENGAFYAKPYHDIEKLIKTIKGE